MRLPRGWRQRDWLCRLGRLINRVNQSDASAALESATEGVRAGFDGSNEVLDHGPVPPDVRYHGRIGARILVRLAGALEAGYGPSQVKPDDLVALEGDGAI